MIRVLRLGKSPSTFFLYPILSKKMNDRLEESNGATLSKSEEYGMDEGIRRCGLVSGGTNFDSTGRSIL